jgi:hypothetical protein
MAKSGTSQRPRLMAVSEEIRRISALLSEELLSWPSVTARPMFGLRAFYRGAVIFAMLPDKRAIEKPAAIAYKLPGGAQEGEGRKWRLLELQGEGDIGRAVACLDRAYRRAGAASEVMRRRV